MKTEEKEMTERAKMIASEEKEKCGEMLGNQLKKLSIY